MVSAAIIVPTRNSARTLRSCLDSIRNQSVASTVIVVDNGSTDDTVRIAEELADLVLHGGPERSAQRNIGAAATDAPVLGFVDSDMILSPDVVRDAIGAIEGGAVAEPHDVVQNAGIVLSGRVPNGDKTSADPGAGRHRGRTGVSVGRA